MNFKFFIVIAIAFATLIFSAGSELTEVTQSFGNKKLITPALNNLSNVQATKGNRRYESMKNQSSDVVQRSVDWSDWCEAQEDGQSPCSIVELSTYDEQGEDEIDFSAAKQDLQNHIPIQELPFQWSSLDHYYDSPNEDSLRNEGLEAYRPNEILQVPLSSQYVGVPNFGSPEFLPGRPEPLAFAPISMAQISDDSQLSAPFEESCYRGADTLDLPITQSPPSLELEERANRVLNQSLKRVDNYRRPVLTSHNNISRHEESKNMGVEIEDKELFIRSELKHEESSMKPENDGQHYPKDISQIKDLPGNQGSKELSLPVEIPVQEESPKCPQSKEASEKIGNNHKEYKFSEMPSRFSSSLYGGDNYFDTHPICDRVRESLLGEKMQKQCETRDILTSQSFSPSDANNIQLSKNNILDERSFSRPSYKPSVLLAPNFQQTNEARQRYLTMTGLLNTDIVGGPQESQHNLTHSQWKMKTNAYNKNELILPSTGKIQAYYANNELKVNEENEVRLSNEPKKQFKQQCSCSDKRLPCFKEPSSSVAHHLERALLEEPNNRDFNAPCAVYSRPQYQLSQAQNDPLTENIYEMNGGHLNSINIDKGCPIQNFIPKEVSFLEPLGSFHSVKATDSKLQSLLFQLLPNTAVALGKDLDSLMHQLLQEGNRDSKGKNRGLEAESVITDKTQQLNTNESLHQNYDEQCLENESKKGGKINFRVGPINNNFGAHHPERVSSLEARTEIVWSTREGNDIREGIMKGALGSENSDIKSLRGTNKILSALEKNPQLIQFPKNPINLENEPYGGTSLVHHPFQGNVLEKVNFFHQGPRLNEQYKQLKQSRWAETKVEGPLEDQAILSHVQRSVGKEFDSRNVGNIQVYSPEGQCIGTWQLRWKEKTPGIGESTVRS